VSSARQHSAMQRFLVRREKQKKKGKRKEANKRNKN